MNQPPEELWVDVAHTPRDSSGFPSAVRAENIVPHIERIAWIIARAALAEDRAERLTEQKTLNTPDRISLPCVNNRELAAILTGLRNIQDTACDTEETVEAVQEAYDMFHNLDPLSSKEIDRLCERLNTHMIGDSE